MNLYDNSNIDCNKKSELYDLGNNIALDKFVHSNKYKNNFLFSNYKKSINKVQFITNTR